MLIEAHTEEVIADEAFAASLTEETLCRILESPRLSIKKEMTLYEAVVK